MNIKISAQSKDFFPENPLKSPSLFFVIHYMNHTYSVDISEQSGVRYLHFGSELIQGAMRIRRPVDLELSYTREMMGGLLMQQNEAWPHHVLLIGLGAASLTKFFYWRLPECHITVVEINPAVVDTAYQFFKLPKDDKRIKIIIDDGAKFMLDTPNYYDYILVDGYDENAHVGVLESLPFYQACWTRLSTEGLLAANLFSNSRRFQTTLKWLEEAFDGRSIAFPSCDTGNVIGFGARGANITISAKQLRERAKHLLDSINLDLRNTVSRLEKAGALEGGILTL